MVLKQLKFPKQDLFLQASYLKQKVTDLCELPSSVIREVFSEKLEEVLRYSHYHIHCVAQYRDLMGVSSSLLHENHTDKLASILLISEDENQSISHLQIEIMRWYILLLEDIRFEEDD